MEYKKAKEITLPVLGLGTWQMRGKECQQAVETALELGYRHIDTAQMYRNEQDIGDALQNSDIPRDEIFLTTKLLQSNLRADDVERSFAMSLERLQMDYVDLLLIHSPNPTMPISETIDAMNALQDAGKVKYIGVSNFSVQEMQDAMKVSRTPIITNQVEYNPFNNQQKILEFCRKQDIALTAYTPLARNRVTRDKTIKEIASKYGKTSAQVTLRWLIQQKNVITIPKSSDSKHLKENIDIFDFSISDGEMQKIANSRHGFLRL